MAFVLVSAERVVVLIVVVVALLYLCSILLFEAPALLLGQVAKMDDAFLSTLLWDP
jgi:hypothetical protein